MSANQLSNHVSRNEVNNIEEMKKGRIVMKVNMKSYIEQWCKQETQDIIQDTNDEKFGWVL